MIERTFDYSGRSTTRDGSPIHRLLRVIAPLAAITDDGRAVAVKVQYPGIAEMMEADLGNVALLRRLLRVTAPSQDAGALLA